MYHPLIAIGGAIVGGFLASGGDDPPDRITEAPNPIADKFPPIDFVSVFDELSKDRLEIIKDINGKHGLISSNSNDRVDLSAPAERRSGWLGMLDEAMGIENEKKSTGKLNIKFSNDSGNDLSAPVQSRAVNTRLPAIDPLNERAAGVVALSQAMTRLGNTIEQMEGTSPYLIQQNQALIQSFRRASEAAIDRGFDHRQYAIDQKLAKYGLDNSSTAFGVQVALAREKANAYGDLELKEAQLAQGLKQQSLANLHQRGQLLGQNAGVELEAFNAESRNHLANQEMIQKQSFAEKQLETQNEERRLATEFGNRKLAEARRNRMAQLGLNAFNTGNSQALTARSIDNNAIAQANGDELARYDRASNPMQEIGHTLLGASVGNLVGGGFSGSSSFGTSGFNTNPWNNPDTGSNPMSFGTSNWSPTSSRLVGSKSGGMRWS
jgi:hypothetical protein